MRKNYDFIDLMKFIASIFVVAIHAAPLQDINGMASTILSGGIARLAVPLFFLASAFLFYNGYNRPGKVKKYLKRMGKLYFCWFVVLLPITIFNRFIVSDYSFGITLFRFIRSFFVTSTFSGSWFLTSCAFCVILFYLIDKFNKKGRQIVTILISIFSYLLCVFTSAYGGLIDKLELNQAYKIYEFFFGNPYTSFLVGIPYFALGKYIATNDIKIKNIKLLTTTSLICLLVEIILTTKLDLLKSTDCYIMLLPCAFLIFLIIKSNSIKIKCAEFLRKASTIIFFSHFVWIFCFEIIEYLFDISIFSCVKFLSAVIFSLIFVKIILLLSNKKTFKWLRFFY